MSAKIQEYTAQLEKKAQELRELFFSSIQSLAAAIDEKDPYTRGHSERVTRYSTAIARELRLSSKEIEEIRIAALLHDVGKIGINDSVLGKPGKLDPEEVSVMQQHPVLGANIMSPIKPLRLVIPGMLEHHEKWDGTGYPYGLAGEEISLMGRIIAVADTFDAMTTHRPYQKAMDGDYVVDKIIGWKNERFDPQVVDAFVRAYEKDLKHYFKKSQVKVTESEHGKATN
jgi:putative nucleotidyltransferase with HDIG domain